MVALYKVYIARYGNPHFLSFAIMGLSHSTEC